MFFLKNTAFVVQKTWPLLPSETILNSSRPGTLQGRRLLFVMIVPPIPRRFAGFDAADNLLLPARNKQILPGFP
jgi:hypothetical protein